jgi:ketosteroid isomerase-like protein
MPRTVLAAASLAALLAAVPAMAATPTPVEVVNHHMDAAAKNDVAAVMSDYADDAAVLNGASATQGKAAIGAMFKTLLVPNGPVSGIKAVKVWSQGDVGFVSWEAGARKGTDSFLVKNGKIEVQAVFIGAAPPAGS